MHTPDTHAPDTSDPNNPDTNLGALLRVARAGVRMRRKRRGPMLPSWDEDFETWATILHYYATRSRMLPLSMQRFGARGMMPPPDHGLRTLIAKTDRVSYETVSAGGVPAAWFRPKDRDESRVLFYLHGGHYSIGSIDAYRDAVSRLCVGAEVRGLVIDYRLAPEHRFPAQLDDALAAYRWMLATGIDPSRVVVAGESAGGALTLSLLVALRDAKVPLPAAAICVSPWVDLELTGETTTQNAPFDYLSREALRDHAERFVRPDEMRHPLAAPLHADLRGLPPLLVLAGGAEVLLDDARRIAQRAREARVDVTLEIERDMIHAWHLFAGPFPALRRTVKQMEQFVRRYAGPPRA